MSRPLSTTSQGDHRCAGPLPRLCIVNLSLPPAYGGAEIAAYRYAERYRSAGGDVVFVALEGGTSDVRGEFPSWVVPVSRGNQDGMTGTRGMPWVKILRKATRVWPSLTQLRHEFDLLHIFNSAPLFNLGAVPLAKLFGKPVILEMSLRGSDDPMRLRQRQVNRIPTMWLPPVRYLLFRQADLFVAKSRALSAAFLESGLAEDKLVRIPYGVDVSRYRPVSGERKKQLRSELGLDRSAPLILFVGSLNPRKGVHWLVAAFSRLAGDCSAQLILVGPSDKFPEYAADLRTMVRKAELESRVTFVTAKATNVHEYMQAADIFALTSIREGLPISILEAMASGLAVVASDIPEIADSQIQHGSEGLLFPTGDVAKLTESLRRLAQDSDERQRLGRRARERALREFATEIVDAQYRVLYDELLGRRQPGLASVRSPMASTGIARLGARER